MQNPTVQHRTLFIRASDDHEVECRTTEPGRADAVVVMQLGTLSRANYFDLMATELAQRFSAVSYAIPSRRRGAKSYKQHADDLDQVVRLAKTENPGLPIVVAGVSLGADIANEWRTRLDHGHTPVVAMSPVVMTKLSYLSPKQLVKVMAGFLSETLAKRTVDSPLSAGIPLTTNPASYEWNQRDQDAKVPVSLFDDNLRMVSAATIRCRRGSAPVVVMLAGADQVANSAVTRMWAKVFRNQKTLSIPGAAHDLSQETNHPLVVDTLGGLLF